MEYVNFNCPDCPKTHTCSICERRKIMEYVNFNCPDCPKTHTCSVCKRYNRNIANGTTPVKDLWTGEI